MLGKVLLIALAGAAGTLARWWLSGAVYAVIGRGFPWGTAVVNILGCLLFGFVWVLAEDRLLIRGETRFIILTGFMGAFTTFSTYMFESGEMLRTGQWLAAAGNLLGQMANGLAALALGMALGRLL